MMLNMSKKPSMLKQIASMEAGDELSFEGKNPKSLSAMASQVGSLFEREYKTAKVGEVVKVWRIK